MTGTTPFLFGARPPQVYSDKGWNDMPYCAADIEATKISEMEIMGSEN